jgi:hypothetical protein
MSRRCGRGQCAPPGYILGGQHEAVCSSGTADEFEALWQTTPFGEAQKKTIKEQQQQLEQQPQQQSSPSDPKSESKVMSKAESEATPMEE